MIVEQAVAQDISLAGIDVRRIASAASVPEALESIVRDAYAHGIGASYLVCAVLAAVALVCIAFLTSKPLSTKTRAERFAETEAEVGVALAGGDSAPVSRAPDPSTPPGRTRPPLSPR